MHRTLAWLLPVFFICLPVSAQDAELIPLKIGKDTTYFTGPVTEDGIIDYVAALNKHYGEGIENEDNAFALMVQLFPRYGADSRENHEDHWEAVFKELGIQPEENRVRLIDWNRYADDIGLDEETTRDRYDEVLEGVWDGAEHPEIMRWLRENDAAMDLFLEALKREAYFSPLVSTGDDHSVMGARMPQLGHCRKIAREMLIRFYFALGKEDMDTAVDLAWSLDRLGYHLSAEQHVIGKLVGFSCRRLASDAFREICARGVLSHHDALKLIDLRARTHDLQSPQESINYLERCAALEQAQILLVELHQLRDDMLVADREKVPAVKTLFDINQSLRHLTSHYDRILRILRENDAAKRKRMSDAFETDLAEIDDGFDLEKAFLSGFARVAAGQDFPAKVFTEKLTNQLALLLTSSFGAAERTENRINPRRLVEATAIAVLGYREQHGKLPGSLDALVPTYFDEVPIDFATGKPLVYRVNDDGSALVYSLGDNIKDDGGVDDYAEGDIAIRIGTGKP